MTYIITTSRRFPGVRLSKPGHFGNQSHTSVAAAEQSARADARGKPFVIERENFR